MMPDFGVRQVKRQLSDDDVADADLDQIIQFMGEEGMEFDEAYERARIMYETGEHIADNTY